MIKISKEINEILKDIFGNEDLNITRDFSAADIEGWDSLTNIRIIVAIEKAFQVRFTAAQISDFKCIGDIEDAIARAKL